MTSIQEAENALLDAVDALNARRRVTEDPQEEAALAAAVERIQKALTRLALDGLAAVSARVSEAADAVAAILRSANVDPFDKTVDAAIRTVLDAAVKLKNEVGKASEPAASGALDHPAGDEDIEVAARAPAPPAAPPEKPAPARPRGRSDTRLRKRRPQRGASR